MLQFVQEAHKKADEKEKDMKAIFVVPSMSGGGAERVVSLLANEFVNKGIETKILMTAGNECVYDLKPEIECFQAGEKTGGSMVKRMDRVVRLRRYFKRNKAAVLIAFEPDAAFFCSIARIGLSVSLISSERNDPASFGNGKTRGFAYRHSNRIVFQTRGAKEYFPVEIQKKSRIIENPIAEDLPLPYTGRRKKTVVCVGRLEAQKNHALLLDGFAKFAEKHQDYTLHLYGKGSLEEALKKQAQNLGIGEKVIFEGFVSDITKRIRDAGMYVLSSDYEGISNSLLEAMAVGLPVISTDCPCGGSGMCIEDGINGYLVPTGDEAALIRAMEKMASDEEAAWKMGKEAAKIRETFSVQKIAEKWIEVITELEKESKGE